MSNVLDLAAKLGLTIEVDIVPPQFNVPDHDMVDFGWWTIHGTANTSPGADARMHRQFVANGGGTEHASFNYCVDDKRVVQILREHQWNYAQGTATGNTHSLSVETCENSDGNWTKTLLNLEKLSACVLVANNKPISVVVQHNIWYGKNCPPKIRRLGQWDQVLHGIRYFMVALEDLMDSETINGHVVSGKFLAEYRRVGLALMGLPISDTLTMTFPGVGELQVQWFERTRLELQADGSVTHGLLGIEAFHHGV